MAVLEHWRSSWNMSRLSLAQPVMQPPLPPPHCLHVTKGEVHIAWCHQRGRRHYQSSLIRYIQLVGEIPHECNIVCLLPNLHCYQYQKCCVEPGQEQIGPVWGNSWQIPNGFITAVSCLNHPNRNFCHLNIIFLDAIVFVGQWVNGWVIFSDFLANPASVSNVSHC